MHIKKGTDVNVAFTDDIVFSKDGTNWTGVVKTANISRVSGNIFNSRGHIKICLSDNSAVNFFLDEVDNQAGWTSNQAGVTQAVADILSWS